MQHQSIEEIYNCKRDVLERIRLSLKDINNEKDSYRSLNGRWSIAEVLEHLSIVETQMLRLINTLVQKAESKSSPEPVQDVSLEPFKNQMTEKYITSEKFNPKGSLKISESLNILKRVQDELEKLKPRIENVDVTSVNFTHWIMGTLNLGQWIAFLYLHQEKHIMQIESVKAELKV